MKVITFSRQFPKGHPKVGQPTWFVEKILRDLSIPDYWTRFQEWNIDKPIEILHEFSRTFYYPVQGSKHHTIRGGNRWKAGDMASLRVWSDKPYRSKQIEFAQVEVKKVWQIRLTIINNSGVDLSINGMEQHARKVHQLAANDGLESLDFINWFNVHPKKKQQVFQGQIICWNENINY